MSYVPREKETMKDINLIAPTLEIIQKAITNTLLGEITITAKKGDPSFRTQREKGEQTQTHTPTEEKMRNLSQSPMKFQKV